MSIVRSNDGERTSPTGKVISTREERERRELKAPLSIILHRLTMNEWIVSAMNEWNKNESKQRTMFQHLYFLFSFVGKLMMTFYRDDIVSFNV